MTLIADDRSAFTADMKSADLQGLEEAVVYEATVDCTGLTVSVEA